MTIATLKPRSIKIEGMTGDVCVNKVTWALKGVKGVTTEAVTVGSATVTTDQAGCEAACAAINDAGYKSQEACCTA
jgi:copper chaperone CopZ